MMMINVIKRICYFLKIVIWKKYKEIEGYKSYLVTIKMVNRNFDVIKNFERTQNANIK